MSFLQTRLHDSELSAPSVAARIITMATDRSRRPCRSELLLVISGHALLVRGDYLRKLAAGDLFLQRPGDEFALRDVQHLVLASVEFDSSRELSTERLRSLAPLDKLLDPSADDALRIAPHHLDSALDAFKRLRQESEQPHLGQELLLAALFYELLVSLARAAVAGDDDPERCRARLAATYTFLHDHYRDALTLEQLADTAGLAVPRFRQAFRQAYGSGPLEFVAGLRLREARELLRDESRSIAEVAFDVGYHDSEHFTRAFRQHYGLTPREFRQLARIGADTSAPRDEELSSQFPPPAKPRKKPRGAAARMAL